MSYIIKKFYLVSLYRIFFFFWQLEWWMFVSLPCFLSFKKQKMSHPVFLIVERGHQFAPGQCTLRFCCYELIHAYHRFLNISFCMKHFKSPITCMLTLLSTQQQLPTRKYLRLIFQIFFFFKSRFWIKGAWCSEITTLIFGKRIFFT